MHTRAQENDRDKEKTAAKFPGLHVFSFAFLKELAVQFSQIYLDTQCL